MRPGGALELLVHHILVAVVHVARRVAREHLRCGEPLRLVRVRLRVGVGVRVRARVRVRVRVRVSPSASAASGGVPRCKGRYRGRYREI